MIVIDINGICRDAILWRLQWNECNNFHIFLLVVMIYEKIQINVGGDDLEML